MSPEMRGTQYEIKVHTLVGESEEDHRRAFGYVAVANDFLRGMHKRKSANPSGYFIENSTITALAAFLQRADAQKFVKALLAGINPVIKFTRGQDLTNQDRYNIEWVNGKIDPTSTEDQT